MASLQVDNTTRASFRYRICALSLTHRKGIENHIRSLFVGILNLIPIWTLETNLPTFRHVGPLIYFVALTVW
jgi:hypothetical protein